MRRKRKREKKMEKLRTKVLYSFISFVLIINYQYRVQITFQFH